MVIGGALGGILGSNKGHGNDCNAATILGPVAEATVGGGSGDSMAETDRFKTAQALENVRIDVPSSWRNPDSGNQYVVVPTRTFEASVESCRDDTVDAVVGRKKEKVFNIACVSQTAVGKSRTEVNPLMEKQDEYMDSGG